MKTSIFVTLVFACTLTSCRKDSATAAKPHGPIPATPPVAGKLVVLATLQELPGAFPADDLYDYAYVVKYAIDSVVHGTITSDTIYVEQYKPKQSRAVAGKSSGGKTGGNLDLMRAGDRHYLVLQPSDSVWSGAVEDNFPQSTAPRWWASWTDRI